MIKTLNFIKMHGLGNDFVIIKDQIPSYEQIVALSNRKLGVGCDQVIAMLQHTDHESEADVYIFNPDGSSAGACGNAMRCITKLLYMRNTKNTSFTLRVREHPSGSLLRSLKAEVVDEHTFAIHMGRYSINWQDIPLSMPYEELPMPVPTVSGAIGYPINVGNTHFVIARYEPFTEAEIAHIGSTLQRHPTFPQQVNVNFAHILEDGLISLTVWERGAGLTLACGSGACASAIVAHQHLGMSCKQRIILPGGELLIEVLPDNVMMTGSATLVFEGTI